MAPDGLVETVGTLSLPGAYGHVEVCEMGREEALQMLDGHGEVRIRYKAVLPLRLQHSSLYC